MKLKYRTNFLGYLPVLRGIQLLLKNKTLNFTQLGAYLCFVAQADFDRKHKNYRVILRDDYELASEWGCSPSTVYRRRMELVKKQLLSEEDGVTKVTNFYMFELDTVKIFAKIPLSTMQVLFTESQEDVAKREFMVAELQKKQDQKAAQSFNGSSNGELGFSNTILKDTEDKVDNKDKI